jgi:hypothetical protein
MRILRTLGAVLLGFIVASLVMMVVESINGKILFPELGKLAEGLRDREAIRALVAQAPKAALLVVILGWALGSFAGGWVAAQVARHEPLQAALILGLLLTCAGLLNNWMIPPPLWFRFATWLVFLPCTWAGAVRVADRL